MTATPSPATKAGSVDTADGWTITFNQVLLALGRASLDGDNCSTYSEASYTRVLTLVGAPDGQKISDSYGLGQCDFGFGVVNAQSDSVLGAGATDTDLQLLRTAGTDKYAGESGISMLVRGKATNGTLTKAFNWAFRGRMRYRECTSNVDGVSVQGLSLHQDQQVDVDITLHAEALFRSTLNSTDESLAFDPIASADSNDDGEVTLDELGGVELNTQFAPSDPTAPPLLSLEDYVYLGAAPTVARFRDTGHCTPSSAIMGRD